MNPNVKSISFDLKATARDDDVDTTSVVGVGVYALYVVIVAGKFPSASGIRGPLPISKILSEPGLGLRGATAANMFS